ncbi:mannose-1-phosphate guanylyltransferase [Psychromicrobium xiongbiense]|uniref:mannose-1-phosphate guanylyltransferase n=1 Tax=Psychromicrobium xiongbiense TaxID=3051184 RepID=UPI002554DD91|nr:sugar phosphate nucleotidyltransferase [Psychromicrobium sp. YIM S02556]
MNTHHASENGVPLSAAQGEALASFHAVIPAGGVGTRLWPLSRAGAPKFLHDLTGSGSTLLRSTYDRLTPLAGERMMVVTGVAHRQAVCGQLPEVPDSELVLESEPKDSAAAIGLAAAILYERDPKIIMGSFAADHVISPDDVFQQAVHEAILTAAPSEAAPAGRIVTIGIEPTHASTGFGYIRTGDQLEVTGAPHAHAVAEFVEKPDQTTADRYIEEGGYHWNAGMFVAPVALMLKHLANNEPKLYAGLTEIAQAWDTEERDEVTARIWPTLPKIAIDYAVAEPAAAAGDVAVIPAAFRWDDVGDFAAIGRLNSAKDTENVTVLGEGARRVFTENASGVVVTDTKRVIALIGISDVVIVDTPDALLVTTTEHAQRVKAAVESLKASGDVDVL